MGGKAGVFSGQNAALVGHKLPQQNDILVVEGIDGEIDLGFGPRSSFFNGGPFAAASFRVPFFGMSFARHTAYLISRWTVCRRRAGLYFLISSFSVWSFLLRVVV